MRVRNQRNSPAYVAFPRFGINRRTPEQFVPRASFTSYKLFWHGGFRPRVSEVLVDGWWEAKYLRLTPSGVGALLVFPRVYFHRRVSVLVGASYHVPPRMRAMCPTSPFLSLDTARLLPSRTGLYRHHCSVDDMLIHSKCWWESTYSTYIDAPFDRRDEKVSRTW